MQKLAANLTEKMLRRKLISPEQAVIFKALAYVETRYASRSLTDFCASVNTSA